MANNNELLRQAPSMLDRNNYVQLYSQVTDPLASGQSDTSSSRARGPNGTDSRVSGRATVYSAIVGTTLPCKPSPARRQHPISSCTGWTRQLLS